MHKISLISKVHNFTKRLLECLEQPQYNLKRQQMLYEADGVDDLRDVPNTGTQTQQNEMTENEHMTSIKLKTQNQRLQ